jgi:hypothetical protein
MCRYAEHGPYKDHFACFACRKAFKQRALDELLGWQWSKQVTRDEFVRARKARVVPCPECGTPMHDMGLDFKAPRQSNVKQWKKVELLYSHGFVYHSCGCCGPGYRPARLNQVEVFIAEKVSLSEAERLLEAYANRRKGKKPAKRRARSTPRWAG